MERQIEGKKEMKKKKSWRQEFKKTLDWKE